MVKQNKYCMYLNSYHISVVEQDTFWKKEKFIDISKNTKYSVELQQGWGQFILTPEETFIQNK